MTTAVDDEGRVLACKRATDEDGRRRLHHEATVLTTARHPGLVELVSCTDDEDATTLYTLFAGTHTLETAHLPLERAAAVVAMTATTVADLHRLGIVHGRLDASHVVLGAGGRPLICSLSGGGAIGELAPPGPPAMPEYRDPAAPDGAPLAPAVDVHALGTLLRVLVVGEGEEADPIPERRFSVRARRSRNSFLRRALLTLADHATDPEPRRRPSAGRLAADIQALVPDAAELLPPSRTATHDALDDPFAALRRAGEDDRRDRTRLLPVVGGVVGLALTFWGCGAFRAGRTGAAPAPAVTARTVAAPATAVTTSEPASNGSTAPDSAVQPSSDGTVTFAGHRYAIGDPGDRTAVGDWNCDGAATVALLRPSNGNVFIFDTWPSEGAELRATAATTVPGAVDLRAATDGPCPTLFAVRADGTEVEVQP